MLFVLRSRNEFFTLYFERRRKLYKKHPIFLKAHNLRGISKEFLTTISMFNLLRLLTYVLAEPIFHSADYCIYIYSLLQGLRVTYFYNI